jgi:hypothetical protein
MFKSYNPTRLEFQDQGFNMHTHGDVVFVEWPRIREIVAYRRPRESEDDLVCLGVRIDSSGAYAEIHEEMDDYPVFLEQMYDAFPEISRKWWREIASVYGENRRTIYGIGLGEDSPAEKYLARPRRRVSVTGRDLKKWSWAMLGLVVLAGLQILIAGFIAGWEDTQLDDVIGIMLLPMILVVISARIWGIPRVLFMQLIGFYVAQCAIVLVFNVRTPCLAVKFLGGDFSYLFVPGLEILAGLGVMLLPQKHVAGRKKFPR